MDIESGHSVDGGSSSYTSAHVRLPGIAVLIPPFQQFGSISTLCIEIKIFLLPFSN